MELGDSAAAEPYIFMLFLERLVRLGEYLLLESQAFFIVQHLAKDEDEMAIVIDC